MFEDLLTEAQTKYTGTHLLSSQRATPGKRWQAGFLLCALGLVGCLLLTITPLLRIPDPLLTLHLGAGTTLAHVGNWLPLTLGNLSPTASAYWEFFGLMSIAFVCYILAALLVRRTFVVDDQRMLRGIIWFGAILVGMIYLVTPAMLSHDILVYASYSRVLSTYHANPYFVPIAAFPQDSFAAHNYWSKVVSAYGPIWMLVCALFGALLHPDQSTYALAFRLFALAFDLLNVWLIRRILQTMGRSARTVTLGMLFYAWNPLLLLESGLGGHNDGFMMTFVLLGILFAVQNEKRAQALRAREYLPTVAALTLACLVKFTALPILAAYLLLLVCRVLRPLTSELRQAMRHWRSALPVLAWSGLCALLLALVCYGPFWFGHKPAEIIASFKNPPSALFAENSFMRSVGEWQNLHPALHNALITLLSNRHFWDDLTIASILLCLLFSMRSLWSAPTTRTFVVVALATMSIVLLITPWFFSWYITWLLGLAIVCLPVYLNRIEAALLVLVCTFSLSALFTYLFSGNLFGSHYYLVSLFTTLPPIGACLATLMWWKPRRFHKTGEKGQ